MGKTTLNANVPQEFLNVFRQLVRRVQPAKALEPETAADYYGVLQKFPMEVLAESAQTLSQTQKFFPSTAEWFQAAQEVSRRFGVVRCPQCADRGLIRVNYHSGEASDLALCDCRAGQWWRTVGDEYVRKAHPWADQVDTVEAFEALT